MNMRPTDEQPDGHKHPDLDDVLSQIDEMESQWRQQDDADGMVESDRVIGGHFAKVASIDSQAHNLEVDSEASSSNSTMSPAVSSETLDSDPNRTNEPGTKSLVISTMLSLFAVLVLLGTVRLLLPKCSNGAAIHGLEVSFEQNMKWPGSSFAKFPSMDYPRSHSSLDKE